MLLKRGFELNEDKTKVITNFSSQRVTGLTVNEKVSIPRDYKKELRQEVYYAIKYGLADSIIKGNKTRYINHGAPNVHSYFSHLKGKMFYVLQIEPENKWFKGATQMLSDKYLYETKCAQCT